MARTIRELEQALAKNDFDYKDNVRVDWARGSLGSHSIDIADNGVRTFYRVGNRIFYQSKTLKSRGKFYCYDCGYRAVKSEEGLPYCKRCQSLEKKV